MGVGVECCFTALFDSNQFSNCYIHVYEKEARSRLFKIQDLPLTYMFEYHRFEFQPNWFLILIPIYLEFCNYFRIRSTWRSRACSCTLWNTCLTVAPTPSHDPWPWTFHLINQSAVARMCCFTMVVQWPLFELIRFLFSLLAKGPFLRSTGQTAVFSNQDMFHM